MTQEVPGVGGACRVCLAVGQLDGMNVREMMFGTRESFRYEFCGVCGSLQLGSIPADLGPYYPADYYAHVAADLRLRERIRRPLVTARNALLLFAPDAAFRLLGRIPGSGFRLATHPFRALREIELPKTSRIVDVGGGRGGLLQSLRDLGYRDLTCIDPYLRQPGRRRDIRFIKARLADVGEEFDVVMYHHALEHVLDLDAELRAIRSSLTRRGRAVIRMPTLPNWAYDRYADSWVQIDAPRHIHIPSRAGFRIAARRNDLRIVASGDDSTEFQYWGSEAYARGVALRDAHQFRGPGWPPSRSVRRELKKRARAANLQNRGDQAWFVLRPFTVPHSSPQKPEG